jgi:hemoglobin-like flavoprotein
MNNDELLNPDAVTLVRNSWAKVIPGETLFADRFYANLFSLDPALRSLFPTELKIHGNKLLHMIGIAVGRLDDPDRLIPTLQQLGCRHVAYGVESAHYVSVGKALTLTLEQCLGENFTNPVRDAWTGFYELMAGIMKEAAYSDV